MFQTGDILIFSSDGFVGRIIRTALQTEWSHAAMLIRLDSQNLITDDPKGVLHVLESNKNIMDMGGAKRTGISIMPADKRIDDFDDDMIIIRLAPRLRRSHIVKLQEFYETHKHKPFDRWFMAQYFFQQREDYAAFFCSEFIAAAYRHMGVFREVPTSSFAPSTFYDMVRVDKTRAFMPPFSFEKLMLHPVSTKGKAKGILGVWETTIRY